MGRAARECPGPRGGEGHGGHDARENYDKRLDPRDPDHDPYRDTADTEEDLMDHVDEEYEWPKIEEEEDD